MCNYKREARESEVSFIEASRKTIVDFIFAERDSKLTASVHLCDWEGPGRDSVRNNFLAVARKFSRPWRAPTRARAGPAAPFESLTKRAPHASPPANKKGALRRSFLSWRRGRDSNPRYLVSMPVFETGAFDHSATSPLARSSMSPLPRAASIPAMWK